MTESNRSHNSCAIITDVKVILFFLGAIEGFLKVITCILCVLPIISYTKRAMDKELMI